MTTKSGTGQQVDAAVVWCAIGRLERGTAAINEGQRDIKAGLGAVDRPFHDVLGVGGALSTAIFACRPMGG